MPSEKPPAAAPPYTSSARLRASPSSKFVVMIDRLAGVRNPALTPVAKRARISTHPDGASPPSPEKAMNTTSAARNMRRRPSRSAARPPSSTKPP